MNTPFLVQDGYHLLNAAVAFTDASERFVVTFGAKNITDEIYLVSGYTDDFAGMVEGVYGRPCEWYLSTRLNF